ncbi:unnamed protein product, partial [Mesorhabditis belari]|uniref:Vacuolar protein-sorting-associated protein 36 n=1 Tax=Mesorhabditis belari TaxID=2138241 RepID=A0AAF3EAG5_9BILA
MDRITWYQPAESMEEILCQAGHVGLYDGDLKQTEFEVGTVSLTLHRIIWADSTDPDRRLVLNHHLVLHAEKHHKSMFGKGGKIVTRLSPAPQSAVGPVASSQYNCVRFVFRGGGEDEFFKKYDEALKRRTWERTPSGSSSGGSRTSTHPVGHRAVGIGGIERRLVESHQRTHETISQAFEDMSKLMETARDMVSLSKSIAEKLRARQGSITDDETVEFKSYLLSLGVSDPVTKSTYGTGAKYFEKLAEELAFILEQPLKECGGMMTLPEVFCRVNRARGLELLSPEDLLNACNVLSNVDTPLELHRFPSGVLVVQLKSAAVDSTIDGTVALVNSQVSLLVTDLASSQGITMVLAKERLLAAENKGLLCRDDSVEGLRFFPNKFLQGS